jgi:hypothetical protein
MFSFRSDKTGFFVTIILLVLLAAAVLTTAALWFSGVERDTFWFVFKWVWGTWWVLCIITVLTRLAIFRWQMTHSAGPPQLQEESQQEKTPTDKETSSPS